MFIAVIYDSLHKQQVGNTYINGLEQDCSNSIASTQELLLSCTKQSGRSPKVVAIFSATIFSSYIIELLQLHDGIQIK